MKNLLLMALCLAGLLASSCTEARRLLDDKADSKAKPTPRTGESSIALKPSPAVSPSPKAAPVTAAVFSGDLAGKAGKRLLYQLLDKNDKKLIKLDVLLSDEQLAQINDVDGGQKWYFDLSYQGEDGFNTGGELLIDITKGKGDLRLSGNHLTGNIVVTNWSGPKQGLMSISAKPASRDAANVKQEEPKSSPQMEGKKKQGDASNPPL